MLSGETSISVERLVSIMRWLAFKMRLNKFSIFEQKLFWTYAKQFRELFAQLQLKDCSPDNFSHNHFIAKQDIARILSKFNVPYPDLQADTVTIWCHFMAWIIPACENTNLAFARGIMSNPNLRFAVRSSSEENREWGLVSSLTKALPSKEDQSLKRIERAQAEILATMKNEPAAARMGYVSAAPIAAEASVGKAQASTNPEKQVKRDD